MIKTCFSFTSYFWGVNYLSTSKSWNSNFMRNIDFNENYLQSAVVDKWFWVQYICPTVGALSAVRSINVGIKLYINSSKKDRDIMQYFLLDLLFFSYLFFYVLYFYKGCLMTHVHLHSVFINSPTFSILCASILRFPPFMSKFNSDKQSVAEWLRERTETKGKNA